MSGADAIDQRPGFAAMLQRLASNGAKTIIVESPDRFARDLAVQLAGHDMLKALGVSIIPASAPDFFIEDTPTAVLVRQMLCAIAQFEKASAVAKKNGRRYPDAIAGYSAYIYRHLIPFGVTSNRLASRAGVMSMPRV